MKKSILALLLVFACLLGLLAGCKTDKQKEETTSPTETTAALQEGELAGILLVNAGASMEIMYDIKGSVLQVEGYGENGLALTEDYAHVRGDSVTKTVTSIVKKCVKKDYLPEGDLIIIKHIIGSASPKKTFLEDAVMAALKAAENANIIAVTTDDLDSNGYISSTKAAAILAQYLNLEDGNAIQGRYTAHAGVYYFTAEIDGVDVYYTVDGANGDIASCSSGDYEKDFYVAYGPEDLQEDYEGEIPVQ